MFGAMNGLRSAYHDRILALAPPAEAAAAVRVVDKLLDIELAIMSRHYQLDSEARRVALERRSLVDRLTAMQTMSAGLAHEVRNPLNAAQLQLELLDRRLRRDGHGPRLTEPIVQAQQELTRLTALLDDFLAFARRPSSWSASTTSPRWSARRSSRSARSPSAAAPRLEIAGAEPLIAAVDGPKLHQVVANLVRNAIEAGGGHVWVAVVPGEERFVIRVADDGPGIPEDVRARMYEPFFTTKESGTGLGMSIVHSLVALHGGTIDLDRRAWRHTVRHRNPATSLAAAQRSSRTRTARAGRDADYYDRRSDQRPRGRARAPVRGPRARDGQGRPRDGRLLRAGRPARVARAARAARSLRAMRGNARKAA